MSWFKRGDRRSASAETERLQTDANTYREVFQNHWKQVCVVLNGQDKRLSTVNGPATVDGVEAVLSNLEQMITLLVEEQDDGGLPGPILQYVLEQDLLEAVCAWCTINVSLHDRLRLQQLRLFEHLISQSRQLLLVHKPIIKPLLRLLIDVAESQEMANNGELEFKLVLVLHQICICISQQSLILESFFSTDADHGPARFLIFSLLIPYIHREGPVGQKARDALLLIMTLSARHPHIGHYIANNSHFCPVLATGLSGLYSSLPRRLTPPSNDWYCITAEDCQRIPDLQMFLNSLEFSNAVVQVAHPLVRDQLIEFIYTGFLVPVLAPALHQARRKNGRKVSREEVLTATAYLDLFVRHVSDPNLLKVVLQFVMTHKYDDTLLLDSLLSRISSNTLLSTVTLSLFNTLIDLNCEDVMFQLVFRYLVPCTHVMVSQRRAVRDLDLYGKSAERFLSLRPSCCSAADTSVSDKGKLTDVDSSSSSMTTSPPTSALADLTELSSAIEESSYMDYLHDARLHLTQKAGACSQWKFRYDGESPPPDSVIDSQISLSFLRKHNKHDASVTSSPAPTGFMEVGSMLNSGESHGQCDNDVKDVSKSRVNFDLSVGSPEGVENKCNTVVIDSKLYASLGTLDDFVKYLDKDYGAGDSTAGGGCHGNDVVRSASEAATLLEEVLTKVGHGRLGSSDNASGDSSLGDGTLNTRTSVSSVEGSCGGGSGAVDRSADPALDVSGLSPISKPCGVDVGSQREEIPVNDLSALSLSSGAEGVVGGQRVRVHSVDNNAVQNLSSFVNISIVPEAGSKPRQQSTTAATSLPSSTSTPSTVVPAAFSPPSNSHTALHTADARKSRNIPKDFPVGLKSNLFLASTPLFSPTGDMVMSPYKSATTPAEEFPSSFAQNPTSKKQLKYLNDPPNIGPFLSSLLSRLEGMAGNSLYFNLLLTGVISQLAAYPQPLLRSFLLNHNLVFQPSVKSLVQVLSSLRQKLDTYAMSVNEFDQLVASARHNLAQRELLSLRPQHFGVQGSPGMMGHDTSLMSGPGLPATAGGSFIAEDSGLGQNIANKSLSPAQALKEKRKVSLADIFRRSPAKEKKRSMSLLHRIQSPGSEVYRHVNNEDRLSTSISSTPNKTGGAAGRTQSLSTWNAVYCSVVLDEFVKELSALSLEHSLLVAENSCLGS